MAGIARVPETPETALPTKTLDGLVGGREAAAGLPGAELHTTAAHGKTAAHGERFVPRRFLANAHLQTIAGNFLPRPHQLPEPEAVLVTTEPGTADGGQATQVLCHGHWQPGALRAAAPTAILVHGLEGSSHSQYVLGNADKLFRAGCNAIRMNMRNCGGTERLTPTLYHSGLSADVLAVLDFFTARDGLRSVSLVGYSMGGNLVLKAAGDLGSRAPANLRSVVAVSPACDLGQSADALHRPANRVYEWRFLRALLRRYGRKAALFPRTFDASLARGIHSLRRFDDCITAPYSGFLSADDYYHRASAARVLSRIRVPTLLLHAADDPFIRLTPETRADIAANPSLTLWEPAHGGHCAFLAKPDAAAGYDGYWAEHTLLRFLLQHA